MLFENEFCLQPMPQGKPLRKSDEESSALLYALHVLFDAGVMDAETQAEYAAEIQSPLTLSQQLAAWRARRKANG